MVTVDGSAINLLGAAETISADIQQNRKDLHAEVFFLTMIGCQMPETHTYAFKYWR